MGQPSTTPTPLSPALTETLAGFTAGIAATLVVHPFDILKTRLQLQTSAPSTRAGQSLRILRHIVRTESGGYAALYRGLAPNMLGNSVSWALYFWWYGQLKSGLARWRHGAGDGVRAGSPAAAAATAVESTQLTSLDYFAASAAAGLSTAALTNPIWVIKTRMLASGRNAPGAYAGMLDGAVSIWRTEGVRGFWHGLVPSLFSISHGAVQFAVYEELKIRRARSRNAAAGDEEKQMQRLSNWDYLVLSGFSKAFAAGATYPLQVVRARLQTYRSQNTYHGFSDAVKQIWAHEGARGFYRGLTPNIVRVLPSTCVTFLVYENTKYYLPQIYDSFG